LDIEALIARGLQVLIALGGAYLLALWFTLAVWTFRDIENRSKNVVTQIVSTLLVVLFWVPGLLLYFVLRPKETLDEAYQRSLEEEYLLQDLEELPLCPKCQHYVEDDYRLCPHCETPLKEPCQSCGRLVDLRWDVCPYCGAGHDHGEDEETGEDEYWVEAPAPELEPAIAAHSESTHALPAASEEPLVPEPEPAEAQPIARPQRRLRFGRPLTLDEPTSNGSMPKTGAVDGAKPTNGHTPNGDADEAETPSVPTRFRVD
jgi:RNA polymerase subunit RPABC4/transcription elongation factor Spt4